MKTGHFLLVQSNHFASFYCCRTNRIVGSSRKGKILEIGTGCGYQTAVLVTMNAFVYTVERQKDLHDFAKKKLREMHLRPKFQSFGDGF